MRPHRLCVCVLLALAVLAAPATTRADTVSDWDRIATDLVTGPVVQGGGNQGAFGLPNLAIVHTAMFDAANSIDRRYRSYVRLPRMKRSYSEDAAVATAARRILVSGDVVAPAARDAVPGTVDPRYDDALAAIPDGPAKTGGVAAGEIAAWALIAERAGDGRFGAPGFDLGPVGMPGVWQPAPVNDPGAWLRNVRPFMVRDARQFRSQGPNALTSSRYTDEYNEVKAIGKSDSATRTQAQTDAAVYWGGANAVNTWTRLIRALADLRPMSTVDRARFYALVYLTTADTAITTWTDKQRWLFWRPSAAIQAGDDDTNPDTVGDPQWAPLITNPPYPDHPSGLSALGGSSVATMQELFGRDDVAFGATNAAGATRSYTRLSQAVDEIVDARVWSGVHFRTADVQGAEIGRDVARWRRDHGFLRPLHHHHR